MRSSIIAVAVLGVVASLCVAGIVAVFPAYIHHDQAPKAPGTVQLLIAAKALPAMSIVTGDNVTVKEVSRDAAPAGSISEAVQAVGRVLVVPMVEGQAFTQTCFVSEGSAAHLAAALPNGMRAVSISLNDDASLTTVLYPGCMVDVLASSRATSNTEAQTRIILQSVQVLAIEDKTIVSAEGTRGSAVSRQDSGRKRLVTLLVDTDQAKLLQAALCQSTVCLALRNPMDTGKASTPTPPPPTPAPVAVPAPPQKVQPRDWEMTVLRGGHAQVLKFAAVE